MESYLDEFGIKFDCKLIHLYKRTPVKSVAILLTILSFASSMTKATQPDIQAKAVLKQQDSLSTRYFPEDTVGRFLKKFGKDSLITVINNSIRRGESFILENNQKLRYDNTLLEYVLVAKQFNLRINYSEIDTTIFDVDYYKLYDKGFKDVGMVYRKVESIKRSKGNLADTIKTYFNLDIVKNYIVDYCDAFSIDKQLLGELYDYTNSLKIDDKIYNYWRFIQFNRKCANDDIGSIEYQEKLFKELYSQNNLKAFYLDTFPKTRNAENINPKLLYENTPNPRELEIFSYKYNPMKLLAYALYGNDVNLKKHAEDLMYLLDAQGKDGSWSMAKKFNFFASDTKSTIYGLWALCEFRDKLQKE